MRLSIIIVSYNTKELLKKCLESIEQENKRSKKLETEIIVVENGSSDGSEEAVKKFVEKYSPYGLTVRLIENRTNLGFARAVNQALRHRQIEGPVLLLNSDTKVKQGALESLLTFEREAGPAIIGARMLNPDGTVQSSVFNLPTIQRAIEEFWLGRSGSFSKYFPPGNQPVEVEAVSGGAMMISKKVVEKIGLFDERYFMYFEDLDYCRKAREADFRVWYLPSAEVIHEHGASGKMFASPEKQWQRLIPSSKIYHGLLKHKLINIIIWSGQKWQKILRKS